MPILSGSMAELAEELKQFEKDNKSAVDRVTAGLAAFDEKHQKALDRLDKIEEKQRMKPHLKEEGGQLVSELLGKQILRDRPKSLSRGQSFNFEVDVKNIVSGLSRSVAYYAGAISGPAPALRLRSIIPVRTFSGAGAIQYSRETALVNNAAPVAEAAAKPQSDLTYVNTTAVAETIAHFIKVSRQTYEDLPALASEIETRMLWMLMSKEEDQLLNGSGVSPNLQGYMTVAAAAAAPPAGSTLVDAIAIAAGQLAATGFTPDGVVVNAADWTTNSLVKDATKQYVTVPAGLIPPVVVSSKMAAGSFLVGAFAQCSTLWQRSEATIQVATQNEDDFLHNLYTILCELRELLAIYQVGGFLKGVVPAPVMEL